MAGIEEMWIVPMETIQQYLNKKEDAGQSPTSSLTFITIPIRLIYYQFANPGLAATASFGIIIV